MAIYVVPAFLVLDVNSEAEAYDGANEVLREQQRAFAPQSCLLDYALSDAREMPGLDPATYEEGRAFEDERCEHGMFRAGAAACPKCGGGAE